MGRNDPGTLSQEVLDTGEGPCGKWHSGKLEFVWKRVDLESFSIFSNSGVYDLELQEAYSSKTYLSG